MGVGRNARDGRDTGGIRRRETRRGDTREGYAGGTCWWNIRRDAKGDALGDMLQRRIGGQE